MGKDDIIYLKHSKKLKKYILIKEPYPHILVRSNKKLHGWWPWRVRECTAERLLINPYAGCSINCIFCYTKGFVGGYFKLFQKTGIVVVWEDFDRQVAEQLDSIKVASCGYLSPITDPFQLVNLKYKLSEKIIYEFTKRNIPIEFITKAKIPQEVIEMIKRQKHSFGQVSILTLDENLRKKLIPGRDSANTQELLENIKRLSKESIHAVARIDPILPYINDDKAVLLRLVEVVKDCGARHIVSSCLDIPRSLFSYMIDKIGQIFGESIKIKYYRLYKEVIQGYFHADITYRRKLFSILREICDKIKVGFSLCMELEKLRTKNKSNGDEKVIGLNKFFSSVKNCEGIDTPLYKKDEGCGIFREVVGCDGACLFCRSALCKIEDLITRKDRSFKLEDYKRWSNSPFFSSYNGKKKKKRSIWRD